eukprot:gnl/TRDRNA2_/TRDRNA2_174668_c0_seq10.p1 gnl/TRDRNA2_/TRDRNA2_174668_c0~~gnl/TRDRNA2_/TRDRNA2_174668_c0_seq10.p1  ORF type:complete len:191 (-),score=20.72 gnl/TRDRNA2_/TRDRNA2_174668_c0_seq10:75-566(-)
MFRVAVLLLAVVGTNADLKTGWTPEPCDSLPEGVPCVTLYKHPAGSEFVTPCPGDTYKSAEGCGAYLSPRSDAEKCPQLTCPKALGVTFKLVCAGGCCPTCWAPDHVLALDRHSALKNPMTVDPHPAAPPHCSGVKCFEPICAPGTQKGFVQGSCCYSCTPGR